MSCNTNYLFVALISKESNTYYNFGKINKHFIKKQSTYIFFNFLTIESSINARPRLKLNFDTPTNIFYKLCN